jgi:hypothetical protein
VIQRGESVSQSGGSLRCIDPAAAVCPIPVLGDQTFKAPTACGAPAAQHVLALEKFLQIQNASRLPSGGISEMSVNAVLAFIEATEPKNEIEAALAIQMACAHAVTMAVLSRAGGAYGGNRHVAMMAAAAARLLHSFTAQVETMRRLRSGGTQVIRIERVEVKEGGQAVIGNLKAVPSAHDR